MEMGMRLVCVAVFGLLGPVLASAAPPVEWNPVRTRPVEIGPQTHRIIVGFRTHGEADVAGLASRRGLALMKSRQISPTLHVMFLQKTLYGADVESALAKLRSDPEVALAAVDQRRYAEAVPNDPLFGPTTTASGQWYMQTPSSNPITVTVGGTSTTTTDLAATDAVSAWNLTTGSTGIVIADIDTGVRFDHPDLLRAGLGGRLLPGYDFVGEDYDPTTGKALGTYLAANDGDGWDPDPSDPGDWIDAADQANALFPTAQCPVENSSWHGTRVVGILGALTNNATGIAGMTWNSWILPVRSLGKCAGYDSDIIAGMQWAAGITVQGVPDNPYPATIINLSLGGLGACSGSNDPYPAVVSSVLAKGVLIVASAGNANGAVDEPADCAGVLAVAGLRNVGTKVGYSSFGPQVGVSAPAGNCINDTPCVRSIDTTDNLGLTVPGANSYSNSVDAPYNLGTSFSAPIVAGIAALMRSVNANLTPAQLIARIESSATPFPANTGGLPVCPNTDPSSGQCSCPPSGQCGSGMVNALAAVQSAQRPIAAVVLPTSVTAGGTVIDASISTAACIGGAAGGALSYAWTASGGVTFASATNVAKVTVIPGTSGGTVTLTVTDSVGATDTAVIDISPTSITTSAPTTNGGASAACPAAVSVTPVAPTVSESFVPVSVGENTVSVLTLTLTNTNGYALTQSNFDAALPGGLTIPATPSASTTCTGTGSSATYTTTSVALTDFIVPASGSCTVTIPVESAAAGSYVESVAANALTTAPAGNNTAASSATLTVTAPSKGGGALGWPELVFGGALLLASRRPRAGSCSRII
jgi:serine protease